MLKFVKIGMLAGFAFFALSSCQNANKDVRDVARQSIENENSPVQPVQADPMGTQTAAPAAPSGPVTTVEFPEERFNFGTITEGEKVKHTFKFKNTGKEPLVLSDARSTCGCTVPTWPREPIAPGKSGEITVEFSSAGKGGSQSKRVTIVANTNPPETFIYMEGDVTVASETNPNN
ncbi:MAG: DUF1573 domain-containing protein [Haliscomenobacter sp.]|nr:DUF1573 domain-containing protein [Haliscomenobacter sp.]MBK8877516.1 DUF1573 domain-containing protein [Haliscomenobacter sp.]